MGFFSRPQRNLGLLNLGKTFVYVNLFAVCKINFPLEWKAELQWSKHKDLIFKNMDSDISCFVHILFAL